MVRMSGSSLVHLVDEVYLVSPVGLARAIN